MEVPTIYKAYVRPTIDRRYFSEIVLEMGFLWGRARRTGSLWDFGWIFPLWMAAGFFHVG